MINLYVSKTLLCQAELDIKVREHREKIHAQVLPLSYDMILGKPWLSKWDPNINWKTNKIVFKDNGKTHTWNTVSEEQKFEERGAPKGPILCNTQEFKK